MDQMDRKPSLSDVFSAAQLFVGGIVSGILVLCTIGFFILLSMYLGGGSLSFGTGSRSSQNSGAVAGDRVNAGIPGGLPGLAKEAGVRDVRKFEQCLDSKTYAADVTSDEQEAVMLGGGGTPFSVVAGPRGAIAMSGALPTQIVAEVIKKVSGEQYDKTIDEQYLAASQEDAGTSRKPLWPVPETLKQRIRALDTGSEPFRGASSPQVTIFEYSDLECPYCKRFHGTMNQIVTTYSSNVQWVYRHFPLDTLHSKARTEALAVECAREQGKFWEMADLIFRVTPSNDGLIL